MGLYAVTYIHRDLVGWQQHLKAHTTYLISLLQKGVLRASGPLTGQPEGIHAALLILVADSEAELQAIIKADPYAIHGQISEMKVEPWDPIFGAFHNDSSMAGKINWQTGQIQDASGDWRNF